MNRVLATALEYLNFVIVLVIIAAGGVSGWLFFRGQTPDEQNIGIAAGTI